MSRLQRFLHSVASSYARLVADSVYHLASVPLALHYLSKEEFGVWILVLQMAGYLALIDFGMTSAVARKLINYKDQRDGGQYGSLLQTGEIVFVVQGALIMLVGFLFSPALGTLLRIPETLRPEFIALMRWYCVLQGLMFSTRIFDQILFAHQRADIGNYTAALQQPVCLAIVWVSLCAGQRLNSILWATLFGWLFLVTAQSSSCVRLQLLPRRGAWGRASWQKFNELFSFGRDAFLVAVGQQLLMASQTFIITRYLGLTAAATWSVCTKGYALLNLLVWRILDLSVPALSEMVVRGERERLRKRLQELLTLSGTMACVAAVLFALCNQSFVAVWTKGRIAWPAGNDLFLAGQMVLLALTHGHCSFIPATGRIGFLRYVYFIEGLAFVVIGSLGVKFIGIPALIASSIVCTMGFSGLYGFWHTAHYGKFSFRDILVHWQLPTVKVILVLAPITLMLWWLCRLLSPVPRLLVGGFSGLIVGCYVLVRFGMPRSLQEEFVNRLPSCVRGVFQRWIPMS
ncbi:MAG: hypothetical protein FJ395_09825 [Verrucomicrobia bacterium]|nr:hypothetical protein [Verrucomicrobiota bacterium]